MLQKFRHPDLTTSRSSRNFDGIRSNRLLVKKWLRSCFPGTSSPSAYQIADYEHVHREMQRTGVTLSLLWVEYWTVSEQRRLPYKSTQFNKYYADYIQKTKATMHLTHKAGEIMQVDWAGQTAFIVDTDTGELLKAYIFVAVLPFSGYAYVEAFLQQKQGVDRSSCTCLSLLRRCDKDSDTR